MSSEADRPDDAAPAVAKADATETRPARETSRGSAWGRVRVWALGLFAALMVVYHVNSSLLDEGDAVPNIHLPIAVLEHGGLTFTPQTFPEMFKWHSDAPLHQSDDFFVYDWSVIFGHQTAGDWYEQGHLRLNEARYYVVQTTNPDRYVSTFGPVPGLTALPLVALVDAFDSNLYRKLELKLSVAKAHAAMLTAGAALLLLLIGLAFTTRPRALLLALAYGLATPAWPVGSQSLWQQTVNAFLLTLGAWAFLSSEKRPRLIWVSGAAFGIAVACRSTSLFFLVAVFGYLALYHRNRVVAFCLAGAPGPLAMAAYNWRYFGSPFTSAQQIVGHGVAFEKTGSHTLFQTPVFEGALGLLASPSRGVLVFSTFFVFAAWGVYRIWTRPEYRALRPLTLATVLVMALQSKWFDWWGGWTYGYRPWLDLAPFWIVFLAPVIDDIWSSRIKRAAFAAMLAWSLFVSALGAFSYDKVWNNRILHVVRRPGVVKPMALPTRAAALAAARDTGGVYVGPTECNIDIVHCRHRLWSLQDNIIRYYLSHFAESRKNRLKPGWGKLGSRQL